MKVGGGTRNTMEVTFEFDVPLEPSRFLSKWRVLLWNTGLTADKHECHKYISWAIASFGAFCRTVPKCTGNQKFLMSLVFRGWNQFYVDHRNLQFVVEKLMMCERNVPWVELITCQHTWLISVHWLLWKGMIPLENVFPCPSLKVWKWQVHRFVC